MQFIFFSTVAQMKKDDIQNNSFTVDWKTRFEIIEMFAEISQILSGSVTMENIG